MCISLAPLRPFLNKIGRNSAAFFSGGHFIRSFWVMRPNNRPIGNPRAAPLYAEAVVRKSADRGPYCHASPRGGEWGWGGYGRKTREKKRKKWWILCNWGSRNTCLCVTFLFLFITLIVVMEHVMILQHEVNIEGGEKLVHVVFKYLSGSLLCCRTTTTLFRSWSWIFI